MMAVVLLTLIAVVLLTLNVLYCVWTLGTALA
jgi:hypothetical protein